MTQYFRLTDWGICFSTSAEPISRFTWTILNKSVGWTKKDSLVPTQPRDKTAVGWGGKQKGRERNKPIQVLVPSPLQLARGSTGLVRVWEGNGEVASECTVNRHRTWYSNARLLDRCYLLRCYFFQLGSKMTNLLILFVLLISI